VRKTRPKQLLGSLSLFSPYKAFIAAASVTKKSNLIRLTPDVAAGGGDARVQVLLVVDDVLLRLSNLPE